MSPSQWKIEINLVGGYCNFNHILKLTLPCSTDVFWVKINDADTLPPPKRSIWINKEGFGIITNSDFPKVKIMDKFYLCCSNKEVTGPKGQLVQNSVKITQSQSLVYKNVSFASPFSFSGWGHEYYYIRNNHPTFGAKNDDTNIYSTVNGTVVDYFDKPIPGIFCAYYEYAAGVPFSTKMKSTSSLFKTDSTGRFLIKSYIPYPASYLVFCDIDQTPTSNQVYYTALDVQPDSSFNLIAKLIDYIQTGLKKQSVDQGQGTKLIRVIQNPYSKQVQIILTNSSYSVQDVSIQIYSAKGVLINTISRKISGAGTFSVLWDKKDSFGKRVVAGKYIVHFRSGTSTKKTTISLFE
jgi:hypothetical protein